MTTFRPNFKETAARPRIAFIQSCWHRDIVDELRDAFLAEQGRIDSRSVDLIEVPGAFEIPLRAKLEALSGTYAAVVAAGLVVDVLLPSNATALGERMPNSMLLKVDPESAASSVLAARAPNSSCRKLP